MFKIGSVVKLKAAQGASQRTKNRIRERGAQGFHRGAASHNPSQQPVTEELTGLWLCQQTASGPVGSPSMKWRL